MADIELYKGIKVPDHSGATPENRQMAFCSIANCYKYVNIGCGQCIFDGDNIEVFKEWDKNKTAIYSSEPQTTNNSENT